MSERDPDSQRRIAEAMLAPPGTPTDDPLARRLGRHADRLGADRPAPAFAAALLTHLAPR